jgi:hypothetical protein
MSENFDRHRAGKVSYQRREDNSSKAGIQPRAPRDGRYMTMCRHSKILFHTMAIQSINISIFILQTVALRAMQI